MDELGYRPNLIAKGFRLRTLPIIGAVVSNISYPFFGELILAIEAATFDQQHLLYLGNTAGQADREASYVQSFIDHTVAGVVVVADRSRLGAPLRTVDRLAGLRIPAAIIDYAVWCPLTGERIEAAHADGARVATAHLLAHGHLSVACLAGPRQLVMTAERLRGWGEAHRARSAQPGPVLYCDIDRQAAYAAATPLLRAASRPTALLAHTDEQAYGILQAAAAHHLRVPEDLAVAAVDGLAQSASTAPPLTTACLPFQEMGRAAIDMVLRAGRNRTGITADPDGAGPAAAALPARLAVRSSCGCH